MTPELDKKIADRAREMVRELGGDVNKVTYDQGIKLAFLASREMIRKMEALLTQEQRQQLLL